MKYVIGIDLGTSGTKTVLFTQEGAAVCSASREYPMYQPQNGWAEQNPEDWRLAAIETLQKVIRDSGADNRDIVSLGISGQMHGLVMLDESGNVLRPSIIWCDQRTAAECEEMTRRVGADRLMAVTANPALTGFTASKILWVRNHEPQVYARCRRILLPKDYLRYILTGDFATEVSDASGMQLLDVPARRWSAEVLERLDIQESLLAKVYESPDVTGHINAETARLTGLGEHTLVVGGAGDNAAAAVGMGVVEDGKAFTTIGTSGVIFAHSDHMTVDPGGRAHTFCCAVPGAWHVMGVTQAAGLSLRWIRDTLCGSYKETALDSDADPYDFINQAVLKSPIGANRLLFLPYLMGERTPHLDADCRGAFIGLSAMHSRRDMLRAVMEGVTYSLRDCLEVLYSMGVRPETMLVCGGGGKSRIWRGMLSDVFELPVMTTAGTEGAALGAAILAAVGARLYPSVREACQQIVRQGEGCVPDAANAERYRRCYAAYVKLYPALKGIYHSMKDL